MLEVGNREIRSLNLVVRAHDAAGLQKERQSRCRGRVSEMAQNPKESGRLVSGVTLEACASPQAVRRVSETL
jgi:hypothetical protein